ncbi:unnamed protein product [Phyllotreta striolata]|uniref:WASH complex subunit 7 n=1 Tax=Phyllotreta striolata TaxID=444603 RepID=A0A9N9TGH9_PHYSR|nr:unnamed protein product [Phyllotreta striolata]
MWETSQLAEKKFNAETNRLIGEAQLHEFSSFLEDYADRTATQRKKFVNSNNVTAQVISIREQAHDNQSIGHLVHSDNKILSRILATLGGMCEEMMTLIKEAEDIYPSFVMYEDSLHKISRHKSISRILEPLQRVHLFTKRVQTVVVLSLKQICCLLGKNIYSSGSYSAFPEVLHKIGDLLICLLKLDGLLDNQIIKDHWFWYRKYIRNQSHSNKLGVDRNKIRSLDKMLQIFENDLLMGHILKGVIEKCFEDKTFYYQLKNCTLNQEINSFIASMLAELEKDDEFSREIWLKMNIFVVLYFNIFESTDKKLIKRILDVNKKYSTCTLIGNIMWYPEQFLLKHLNVLHKYIDERAIENHRLNLVSIRNSNYPKECSALCLQVCYFLIELEKISALDRNNIKLKELQNIVATFTDGLKLLRKISYSVQWTLNVHADKNLPLQKSVLLSICKLIEILKSVPLVFRKQIVSLTCIFLLTTQHLSHKALALLGNIRKQFTQEKSYNERQLDVLSSLNLCEQTLKSAPTPKSILIANLALSASGLYSNDLLHMRHVLSQLETIMSFSDSVKTTSDCSFVFWHQNYMLPVYFSKILSSKSDISRHYLMVHALNDSSNESSDRTIKEHFYNPLEQIIERNLRLQTHLHLQLPPMDPFENYFSINFNKYRPVALRDRYKNVKSDAEHHLSAVFYNLTSVVLHNWKTYGEMRRLAHLQYGLDTVDDNLPIQTLEQGLDVLEIMRNIDVFVAKYHYNLNSQAFVERRSDNKHLNTINISQVANSIRTHGIGIMNTTVNFTYQFLRAKFYVFSQFIYDEQIKSRLIRDLRFFGERKSELGQMYPYERAEKFNAGIRKLGLNEQGESYLDLFRRAVTQIGNAVGYVRLIRSGGRRCLADGTCFIPDLRNAALESVVGDEELPEFAKQAADTLLETLRLYLENMDDATEYFQLLVKVFVPVLRSKQNIHLKNFYAIVPPLTVNFVEYSLACKERLSKRNRAEYTFTDDGFALGLAYAIEILNQHDKLNGLHWFQSVQRKFGRDRARIKEQMAVADNCDNKLRQALVLTEKKVALYEKEFRLLYYSYNSARLFFEI